MKPKKIKPLTSLEWTTCWMAMRYAMGRKSAVSVSLPNDLIMQYFHRWDNNEKDAIVHEIEAHFNNIRKYSAQRDELINWSDYAILPWVKMRLACDETEHFEVIDTSDKKHIVFKAAGTIYPLDEYLKNPYIGTFLPDESIKNS